MDVFCLKCGTKIENGVKFCPNCGAVVEATNNVAETPVNNFSQPENVVPNNTMPVNPVAENVAPENTIPNNMPVGQPGFAPDNMAQAPAANNNKKNIAIIAGAAAGGVAVLAIIIALLAGSSSYKSVIDDKLSAFEKGDAKKLASTYPEFFYSEEYDSAKDFADELEDQDFSEPLMEFFEEEVGEKVKLSYKIDKIKDVKGNKLEDFREDITDMYDVSMKKIKKVKKADIIITAKGKDGKAEYDWEEVYLLKEGGKWRIVNFTLEMGYLPESD